MRSDSICLRGWRALQSAAPVRSGESSAKLRGACLTLAHGCSPRNGDKRKRALSGASLAAAMANHQHVLFDDEGVGRSPRSVAAKARYYPPSGHTQMCLMLFAGLSYTALR